MKLRIRNSSGGTTGTSETFWLSLKGIRRPRKLHSIAGLHGFACIRNIVSNFTTNFSARNIYFGFSLSCIAKKTVISQTGKYFCLQAVIIVNEHEDVDEYHPLLLLIWPI